MILRRIFFVQSARENDQQNNGRGENVQAVRANQRIKRRAVIAGGEGQSVIHQTNPLRALHAEENRSQRTGEGEPIDERPLLSGANGCHGAVQRVRADEQHERVDRRDFNWQAWLIQRRPRRSASAQNQKGANQAREEHRFRAEENHQPEK